MMSQQTLHKGATCILAGNRATPAISWEDLRHVACLYYSACRDADRYRGRGPVTFFTHPQYDYTSIDSGSCVTFMQDAKVSILDRKPLCLAVVLHQGKLVVVWESALRSIDE